MIMNNWVKEHFRDAQHARDTVAIGGFVVGAVGILTTLIALAIAHWGAHLP
jgi:hypothetical protein